MSINLFVASGNIGKDCEQRYTQNGKCIATFSLPVKQGYGKHEKVSWVNCKMFGAKAEKLTKYLTKGVKVTVSGEFVLEQWEKEGQKHSMACVVVNNIDFGGNSTGKQYDSIGVNKYSSATQQEQKIAQSSNNGFTKDDVYYSDEIPF